MENESVYLALGTNLGEREQNLQVAIDALQAEMRLVKKSAIYVTPPWGFEDQSEFLNQVIEVRTNLEPLPLLAFLKDLETTMGRVKTFRNGPRLIDLDILFYGERLVAEPQLQIPHPRLQDRAFVLVPLCEIAPGLVHPRLNRSVRALLSQVDVTGVVKL